MFAMLQVISPRLAFLRALLLCCGVVGQPSTDFQSTSNIVKLSYGSFQGNTAGDVAQFLGMPFAAPPTGQRRFELPEPPLSFDGVRSALAYSNSCPQQPLRLPKDFPIDSTQLPPPRNASEDCLYLNVIRPSNIPRGEPLPVVFWIYGGSFATGDSADNPGDAIVARSVALNEPVVFVSANYRLNAFGFLGGKEVKDAGLANAGLHDQRFALKWVNEHISHFGGDPHKVTIWGQSAGGVSSSLHMLANDGNTEGLFVGSILESGFPFSLPTTESRQDWFDFIADQVNCTAAQDRLQCLRDAPYEDLVNAVDKTPGLLDYQSLNIVWRPTVDGQFITQDPLLSVQQGKFVKIPVIAGDVEDEGTITMFGNLNITTTQQFQQYIKEQFYPNASDGDLQALAEAYPEDPAQGSPYNTGTENVLSPQNKRIASFSGDYLFEAPRRFFLEYASKGQATYSYKFNRTVATSGSAPALPGLGVYHGFELPEFFAASNMTGFIGTDAIVNFAYRGDPNTRQCDPIGGSKSLLCSTRWPKWTAQTPLLFTFEDPAPVVNITTDTFRQAQVDLLNRLWLQEVKARH